LLLHVYAAAYCLKRHSQHGSIVFVALLLLSGDIKVNSGAGHITIGSLNARSAVGNAAEVLLIV